MKKGLIFSDIRKVFPEENWDVGYLSMEQLNIIAYSPIKMNAPDDCYGYNFTNSISYNWLDISNAIILVKKSSTSMDYNLINESSDILNSNGYVEFDDWAHLYMNFKEAEILAGIGIRAKNSLVYNYRFGFDSKICIIGFNEEIQDVPRVKRVPGNDNETKYWKNCDGCNDCAKACPVGAIHNDKEPYWLDSKKCNDFIGFGNHPTIPSLKKYWHKNVHPEISKAEVDKMGGGRLPFDANGYSQEGDGTILKNGVPARILSCKECQVQPRCSKWNGNYNYKLED